MGKGWTYSLQYTTLMGWTGVFLGASLRLGRSLRNPGQAGVTSPQPE